MDDRSDQLGDRLEVAERGRDGRDRGSRSKRYSAFLVFACGMIGAVVLGWISVSTARPSATNYAPGVGALITGLIFGFLIGGIVGLAVVKARRSLERRRLM
jgi:uncharacterized transporter YbjL